jgi:putative addiction module killer protein
LAITDRNIAFDLLYPNGYSLSDEFNNPHGGIRHLARWTARCEGQGADYFEARVSEMRIDFGPGYRVYFFRRELQLYVVLGGGDKSTQKRDIKRAKDMARQLKETQRGKKKN